MDKFHSATAEGKNRQFKEARKRNIGNIVRRADAEMAILGPAPKGLWNLFTPPNWRLPGLLVERWIVVNGIVDMSRQLAATLAICSDGAMPSTSIHSRYERMLVDLPISGNGVRLQLSF
ncbi:MULTISPECIES: hypothetical protein [unclassified Novosphingobium]|uniref:hypothetical protein n=1 Tax=unclassified Novosphingobium TaxID=2644732 RepID=UPI001494E57A|nr:MULTISPECIES: hypothetical protein [unclassified Novosphingobium]MBB3358304.1 hypothetical protein [Novosphingobium sp. BK256]MBB3374665.1 hypothetical protein [Novosphingobium sp. BK280]MBB3379077.1 hypothetical protein [Novosphingobium sp. BK258]MBB3420771.1 hypothetical protein [Novosphingobium sp. BK267]MBB3448107.1 hypothetical protein [Novosphingobium sp. BK352]